MDQEEEDVDDLLNFANNLDYNQFIEDIEIMAALKAIRDRVKKYHNDDWKAFMTDFKDHQKETREDRIEKLRADNRSQASSVAESRLDDRIEDKKKKEKDWETSSRIGEEVAASETEQMAKLIADKVLLSNPKLRDKHSNKSIRQLLEKEAKEALGENLNYQGPTIVTYVDKDIKGGAR